MPSDSKTSIRCILFDVGGVLVELSGINAMLQWMRQPTDVEGLWRAWLTSPTVRDFERGRLDGRTFADRLVAEFDLNVDAEQFLPAFIKWPRGPIDGAYALLEVAAARHRPRDFEQQQRAALAALLGAR